jgi:hypothetical protein
LFIGWEEEYRSFGEKEEVRQFIFDELHGNSDKQQEECV